MSFFFLRQLFFCITEVVHCPSNFMCIHFFKGDFKFRLLMLLILGLDHIFEMKAATQYGFWSLFESACCSFFEGAFISDRYIFLVGLALMMRPKYLISCHNPVRRTRNWFLAVRSSLLFFCYPVTNTRCSFLFLAGHSYFSLVNARWSFVLRCSPLARFPIAAHLYLVAAAFSVLACLYSLHAAHDTSSC